MTQLSVNTTLITPALLPRLSTLLSQTTGIDKAYRFLVYALRIVSVSVAKRHGAEHPLVQSLNNFTAPLADTRMVLRFFGLLPMVQEVLRLWKEWQQQPAMLLSATTPTATSPNASTSTSTFNGSGSLGAMLLRRVELLQTLSMLVYYPAEHLYWLGEHKVLPSIQQPYFWSRLSCRAWAAWIALDLWVAFHHLVPLHQRIRRTEKRLLRHLPEQQSEEAAGQQLGEMKSQREDLLLRLVSLATDLPLAVHWSLESYPLPDLWVGILGLVSTVASTMLKWKYTK